MKCYYISFCELGGIEETGERFLDKIATLKLGELSDEELMVFNKKIIKTKFIYNDEVFDITYRIKIPEMPPTNEIYEIYENDWGWHR